MECAVSVRRLLPAALLVSACWGANAHILEGEVISVKSETEVVIQHEEIPGLMRPMTMPFTVRNPKLLQGLKPGDRVYGRLIVEEEGWYLAHLRKQPGARARSAGPSKASADLPPAPLRPGKTLDGYDVPLADGDTFRLGEGQRGPVLLTFLYTTCPQPEFCPAIANKLQKIQAGLQPGEATLLAITIDPEGDSPKVLREYAEVVVADPKIWRFGRVDDKTLTALAGHAALTVDTATGSTEILHSIRFLVLDASGRLIERYDDARFPTDRVIEQLKTGGPPAPPDSDGTLTPSD
ncbi:MAG: hypothetical protein EA397_03040 [Deltaproteobacteria bacterium]|nr:MAG: hypothetical protein EA397_03040 [Deltaproteobacteria bacterium]